jgi:hypothetical protein
MTGSRRRAILVTLLALVMSCTGGSAVIATGYLNNNRSAAMPAYPALAASRDRAIGWLRAHEAEALSAENAALWWMVRESAALTGDAYLADLHGRYYQRYLAGNPASVWHHLFDADATLRIPVKALADWPDYNLLFLYGLSCQTALRSDARVAALLEPHACGGIGTPAYFRDPACLTHQLMGVRFMQQRRCEDAGRTARLAGALVDQVVDAATWDFRVVDFYLQRLLMLAESGNAGRIQPRWLLRVLEAQQPDGGWDDFDPVLGLGKRSLGWTGRGLRLRKPESNFHTTAQGLYLMALLAKTGRAAPE